MDVSNSDEYVIKVIYPRPSVIVSGIRIYNNRFLSITEYADKHFISIVDNLQSASVFRKEEIDSILKRAKEHFSKPQAGNGMTRDLIPINKEVALVEIMMES